jgi:hypothetical protein
MKTILAIALIVTAVLAALSMWGSVHARRMGGSSSQIFIHGTPVCVTQRGGQIEAAIGECGTSPGASEGEEGGFHPRPNPFGNRNPDLPPGHPPVGGDPDLGAGGARRIPI